jgi:hypothetical protein
MEPPTEIAYVVTGGGGTGMGLIELIALMLALWFHGDPMTNPGLVF